MSVSVEAAPMSLLRRYWRDRALWTTIADVYAILTALALPWSTSLVAIFMVLWLGAVVWVMDWRAFGRLLKGRSAICRWRWSVWPLSARSGLMRSGARS